MSDHLSDRGRQLVASPPFPPYLQEHFRRVGEREAVESDYVGLCVAENKLVQDVLDAKITACRTPPGPALGYGPEQREALERTLQAVDADVVVSGTPLDLAALVDIDKPIVRARYGYRDGEPSLGVFVDPLLERCPRAVSGASR